MNPALSPEDSRLLFALLDAADEDGLLRDSEVEMPWRQIKSHIDRLRYQAEGTRFWAMIETLDQLGRLDHTWMQARWHDTRDRVMAALK